MPLTPDTLTVNVSVSPTLALEADADSPALAALAHIQVAAILSVCIDCKPLPFRKVRCVPFASWNQP